MDDEESLSDGIVEVTTYAASQPPRKAFLPWHRPRKQAVRQFQWLKQIGLMLDDIGDGDGTIRYLGLPGVDLLDLRFFHENVCRPRGIGLRFLGFNTALSNPQSQTELNISLDEVRRLHGVDSKSDVIPDQFERVANLNSLAWKRTFEAGPFDVINLDLCNGVAQNEAAAEQDNHYRALAQLLSLQSTRKKPWLLLLTTLAGREHVHESVLATLLRVYEDNLTNCASFRQSSTDRLNVYDADSMHAATTTDEGLLPILLCSLCKWLAGIALAQRPPTSVQVKSVMGYRVNGAAETEDLVSLAIRFNPTLVASGDPAGLAAVEVELPDECAIAVQALGRVTALKNTDTFLRDNPIVRQEMIDATALLLEVARYDPVEYRAWVAEQDGQ